MTSLCVECDAEPGACGHTGPRYLEPISYDPVVQDGALVGWRVPEHEQERWETIIRGEHRPSEMPHEAKPIQRLIVDLEAWADISGAPERELRIAHERDPVKATRLVAYLIDQIAQGNVRNPSGLLLSRLRAT